MPNKQILIDALYNISQGVKDPQAEATHALLVWSKEEERERQEAEQAEAERKARLVRTIVISHDSDASNPRTEWDNVGTMACWHRRYNLGDEDGPAKLLQAVRESEGYDEEWENESNDEKYRNLSDPKTLVDTAEELGVIMLPLYLYDHSGITMRTTSFNDRWDSGQVGVIFVTRKKAEEEWGKGFVKVLEVVKDGEGRELLSKGDYYRPIEFGPSTATFRDRYGNEVTLPMEQYERVENRVVYEHRLNREVEVYDQYLCGDVYGYTIYEHDKDEEPEGGEHIDSCGGFYGSDYKTNGMIDYWPEGWESYNIVKE